MTNQSMAPDPQFLKGSASARSFRIGAVGDLIWDVLPQGKQLGGAAVNFACIASRLGNQVDLLSSVGNDRLGEEARLELRRAGISDDHLQVSIQYPTGRADVQLNSNGDASFKLHAPVAWDDLLWTDEWESIVSRLDAIYFGSLCRRDERSNNTVQQMIEHASADCTIVFDVNLRPPFYSSSVLRTSLQETTILKVNEEELPAIMRLLDFPQRNSVEDYIADLFDSYPLELIAVTFGASGSLISTRKNSHRHYGISVTVADTVGAGDAFTAALTSYYLRGAPIQTLNEAGNVWGSWVASEVGATPTCPLEIYDELTRRIAKSMGNHPTFESRCDSETSTRRSSR
jgi:fructokinase